jgi:uncharacterized protein YkwD
MKKRFQSAFVATVLLLSLLPTTALAALSLTYDDSMDSEEWEVLRLTNQHRMAMGLNPLSTNDDMQMAANQRSEELTLQFSSDHARPDGSACFTVLKDYHISYSSAAENIAYGYGSAAAVVNGWLNSAGHRKNIETAALTHLGVGHTSSYWSQDFVGGACSYSGLSLSSSSVSGQVGQDLEELLADADITVIANCSQHGSSYLPLIADMCSGYDPSVAGAQEVTVSLDGSRVTLTITTVVQPNSTEQTTTPQQTASGLPFRDVAGHWAIAGITYVYENGLFSGTSATTFDPDVLMSRGMVVTVLAHCAGVDTSDGATWYSKGQQWSMDQNISDGSNMLDSITREQLVTMLYRYAASPVPTGDLSQFSDAAEVSGFAVDAMGWAVGVGLLNGMSGRLNPQGSADRAQAATMMMRFCQIGST